MNLDTVHYLNIFLGLGTIILQILSVIAILVLFFIVPTQKRKRRKNLYIEYINKNFLFLGFLISLSAVLFSLFYSEALHFPPCQLCWFQRIFMFPQVFIFSVAFWNNFRNQTDEIKNVIKYATPLLCVGFLFSIYHNFVYYLGNTSTLCDPSGISCFQHLVSEFGGYISIPMLSLTSFLSLLTLILVAHFYNKNK